MRILTGVFAALVLSACSVPDVSIPLHRVAASIPANTPVLFDTATGAQIDTADLARRLSDADIVVLGEVHDNPGHHRVQAELVRLLNPAGLAFEMIPRASEEGIAVFLDQGGAPGDIGPAIGWNRLGWPDWTLYRPIVEAAPDAVITGGALPKKMVRQAIRDGAPAAAEPEYAAALADPLPADAQAALEQVMIDSHCGKLPAQMVPGMVEAQRLRDASFAAAVLRARATGQGRVVLITGTGHAHRDRGVPLYLARLAPDLTVLTVGMTESDELPDKDALSDEPFDALVVTGPTPRPDPCAAFQ